MFVCVRLEELVPKDHILRRIDKVIDLGCIDELTKDLYSRTGRPSIDPEVLIRMMIIGYLFGITSERQLCDEVQVNMAYRWFCGLTLEDKVPNHSTFSKNRHGRFSETTVFRDLFYDVVRQAMDAGLARGRHLSVDATEIDADASVDSMVPIVVEMKPATYLNEVESQNPQSTKAPKRTNSTHRSKTDEDARLKRDRSGRTALKHSASVLMDNANRVIMDVEVTEPVYAQEGEAAAKMVSRSRFTTGVQPETVGADAAYATGETLRKLHEAGVEVHAPDPGRKGWNQEGIYPSAKFEYDEENNAMICPAGKQMRLFREIKNKHQTQYIAKRKDCKNCPLKTECTKGRQRIVSRHWDKAHIDRAERARSTHGYKISQHCRKRIESLFGEAKVQMGLRRARRRGRANVEEQVLMTAMALNIKRIVNGHMRNPCSTTISSLIYAVVGALHTLSTLLGRLAGANHDPDPFSQPLYQHRV